MRGFLLIALFFLGQAISVESVAQSKSKVSAMDVDEAIGCLKEMAQLRAIQVNYQVSSDGYLAMRGPQKTQGNKKQDTFYLFSSNGQSFYCDGGQNNEPPCLNINKGFDYKKWQGTRGSQFNCKADDKNIAELIKTVETSLKTLTTYYKAASGKEVAGKNQGKANAQIAKDAIDKKPDSEDDKNGMVDGQCLAKTPGAKPGEAKVEKFMDKDRVESAAKDVGKYRNLLFGACTKVKSDDTQKMITEARKKFENVVKQNEKSTKDPGVTN